MSDTASLLISSLPPFWGWNHVVHFFFFGFLWHYVLCTTVVLVFLGLDLAAIWWWMCLALIAGMTETEH